MCVSIYIYIYIYVPEGGRGVADHESELSQQILGF